MQRSLGEKANVHFTKYGAQDQPVESNEPKDMEVGLEYKLRKKESLKLELRDEEEFVGIERKTRF